MEYSDIQLLRDGSLKNARNANLQHADLTGANLRGANLQHADLRGANLRDADLTDAGLRGANLQHANLRGADLRGADLRGANLRGAGLRGAGLTGANLTGANLRGAGLTGANLTGANLRGADLDFSCWPLWCGSFGVKVDDRIVSQLFGHIARLDISECSESIKTAVTAIPGEIANHICARHSEVKKV